MDEQGLPPMSQPKQHHEVLNLASLSSLELITLINMFVWSECILLSFYFFCFLIFLWNMNNLVVANWLQKQMFSRGDPRTTEVVHILLLSRTERSRAFYMALFFCTTSFTKCPELVPKGLAASWQFRQDFHGMVCFCAPISPKKL